MWPPLLHACVLTSLLIRGDPKSGISEYRFAPIFKPRLYDPKEGALDGYHRGMEICLKVPGDAVVRISPDETQRSVLNRQKDPLIREFVRTNWPSGGILKKCVNSQAAYPLSEQHGLKARERRYTAHEERKHWE